MLKPKSFVKNEIDVSLFEANFEELLSFIVAYHELWSAENNKVPQREKTSCCGGAVIYLIVLSELKFKSQLDVRVDVFNILLLQIAHYLIQRTENNEYRTTAQKKLLIASKLLSLQCVYQKTTYNGYEEEKLSSFYVRTLRGTYGNK